MVFLKVNIISGVGKKQLFYFFSALAYRVGKKMNVLFVRWLF
jgi:hypothetical protein